MSMTPDQIQMAALNMLNAVENESVATRKVIAAIPEHQIQFKLGEKGWTAGFLAWHIVLSEAWFAESIINGEFAMTEPAAPEITTVAAIVKWYDEHVPALRAKVRALSTAQLAKPINFFN